MVCVELRGVLLHVFPSTQVPDTTPALSRGQRKNRTAAAAAPTMAAKAVWCCDDTSEGTLFNGVGDARVHGLASQMQTDEQTAECIATLEASRRESREKSRAAAEAEAAAAPTTHDESNNTPLDTILGPLRNFSLRDASAGGPELKLYDAMLSPDRQLVKAGYFVAEGSLVIQQVLTMPTIYKCASILSTEAQLRKLVPEIRQADAAYTAAAAEASSSAADVTDGGDASGASSSSTWPPDAPCLVFSGGRADVSRCTGFKHSALSILAIVYRPPIFTSPLDEWVTSLKPAPGTRRPTILVLDSVIKPENVGSLFRTALAFGVSGVLLSPGCADPLYRKSIRASMGGCFKLPHLHAPKWPVELDQLKATHGYRLLALHLQGSVAHDEALQGSNSGGGSEGEPPLAVMVGAEYAGVGEEGAARSDVRVRIPMSDSMEGSLDSLNVNVAAAIVLERVFAGNRA